MVKINELTHYTQQLMQVERFKDYCPNGLQVEGRVEVNKIVTGVTASMALLEAAQKASADLILVHHGYFWKNEVSEIVGIKQRRIKFLLVHDINLMAFHLPLDAHGELGNNVQLGNLLGFKTQSYVGADSLLAYTELEIELPLSEIVLLVEHRLGRKVMAIGEPAKKIKKIAWCTGAAQSYIDQAIALDVDLFISGEISEQTTHQSLESGVAYISAGHHATERYGVQALGRHLAGKFNLEHEFIDIHNPV
ncbi:MAG: Nif3-like dinuclear metal center hexameric protein [Methylotenera sp.]|nr:Nif3-like dinuclear metal center hexameric protein [Methylotenera sp.]